MSFRKVWLALAALSICLAGCATGGLNGYGPVMGRIVIVRTDGQKLTMAQYLRISQVAADSNEQIDKQLSTPVEAAATGFVVGGATGAGSTVGGAAVAYGVGRIAAGPIAAYAGIANGGMAGYSAVAGYSANKSSITGTMTERAMRDLEKDDLARPPEKRNGDYLLFHDVHAVGSAYRTLNGDKTPAPGLVETPAYSGARTPS